MDVYRPVPQGGDIPSKTLLTQDLARKEVGAPEAYGVTENLLNVHVQMD